MAGQLQLGRRGAGTELRHHVADTTFALTALGRNTEFELNLGKAQPGTGMAGDVPVRNSAADTDDHGLG